MSIWTAAHGLLNASVVAHLGEELVLADEDADGNPLSATVRGVLTRSEELVRIGLSHMVANDARLTLRTGHRPAWFKRGTRVTAVASGDVFEVATETDNGEGLTEAQLSRLS